MPEAKDLGACALAEGKRGGALLGDGLEAPGAADDREQRPDEARNYGQHEALAQGELFAGCCGHFVDFRAEPSKRGSGSLRYFAESPDLEASGQVGLTSWMVITGPSG